MPYTPRERQKEIWEKASQLEEFSVADISKLGVPLETARGYVTRWERDKKICLIRQGKSRELVFAPMQSVATKDGAKPIAMTPENHMWTAMRGLKSEFTVTDISAYASHGGIEVSREFAQAYLQHLADAGFVKVIRRAIPGRNGQARYRLIRDTGPFGPCVQRAKVLVDPNTETFSVLEEASIWQRF